MKSFEDRLIELVEEHPIIFDNTFAGYKRKNRRRVSWNNIANQLGSTSKLCQRKWKNIRNRYMREKREHKLPSERAKRKPKYSQSLSFLDKFATITNSQETKTTTNLCLGYDALEFVDTSESSVSEDITVESSNDFGMPTPTKTKQGVLQSIQKAVNSVIEKTNLHALDMYMLSFGDSLRAMERHEQNRVKFEIARIFKNVKYKKRTRRKLSKIPA